VTPSVITETEELNVVIGSQLVPSDEAFQSLSGVNSLSVIGSENSISKASASPSLFKSKEIICTTSGSVISSVCVVSTNIEVPE